MKVVVIGGTGLIGSKLVTKLREHGHEAVAASPNSGVNSSQARDSPSAEGRLRGRRCNELTLVGRHGRAEVLRDINP